MNHKEFNYTNIDEILKDSKALGLDLYLPDNLDTLKKKVTIGEYEISNSLAFHPMEGTDSKLDGGPDELTIRRYERFAKGGAGLMWFEAVAVVQEGRASPRQLWIYEDNLSEYQKLYEYMDRNMHEALGKDFKQLRIMQLTHSGRFSKPGGQAVPIIAVHNPYLDPIHKLTDDYPVITDDQLESLEEKFEEAAVLAQKAGFQGVDIKGCHRYLNSELFSAFTRQGRYGETFEGRTRFLLNIVDRVKARLGSKFIVTTRMNIYDGIAYPYGFGVDKEDYSKMDLSEPLKLIGLLYEKGVRIINLTMGTPYYNPHVNRPYDKGPYIPQEHQLVGVNRMTQGIATIQKAYPDLAVVGTGYSWLRQFSANYIAGCLEKGYATIAGYGREAFAYPDFARDIIQNGGLKKEKCCIACGKCTEIMRSGGTAGCVIRDAKVYAPIYSQYVLKK